MVSTDAWDGRHASQGSDGHATVHVLQIGMSISLALS